MPALANVGLGKCHGQCFAPRMMDAGDTGLRRLLLDQRGRLLRFLAARGAGNDAEDVLQDLWQRLAVPPGQPIADPVAYLFRAAENLMRDRHRANVARERREEDWHDVSTPEEMQQPGGERVLIARQRLAEAEAVLAELGPRVDQVFRRYRLEGVGQAEIARDLGISLSSVEKDLQKAYRALATLKATFDAE
jgi:RNA polymerase sigma factor (sigma-70 family)